MFRRLLPLIYDDLRRVAAAYLSAAAAGSVLQPTAVVHEAYLRVECLDDDRIPRDREHLFATLALGMRQILASHARAERAARRGGDRHRTTLGDEHDVLGGRPVDLIDLDDALVDLSRLNEMHHEVVVYRYLGGLTIEETARVLGRSLTTVKDAWAIAKAWLKQRLGGEEQGR